MPEADLYLTTVDPCRYWPDNASMPCRDFLTRLEADKDDAGEYRFLTPEYLRAFKLTLEPKTYLPSVPQLTVPQPMSAGLFPVNEPNENALVIVTGNNVQTFEVLGTIWSQGVTPAYFLLVDSLGSTVDMAMIFGEFTPARLAQAISDTGLENKVRHRHMIVPGLTAPLANEFAAATHWEIEVGPVCAVELPLFLGDRWKWPAGR